MIATGPPPWICRLPLIAVDGPAIATEPPWVSRFPPTVDPVPTVIGPLLCRFPSIAAPDTVRVPALVTLPVTVVPEVSRQDAPWGTVRLPLTLPVIARLSHSPPFGSVEATIVSFCCACGAAW